MARHRADLTRQLDVEDGTARFWRGDVVAAHDALIRLPAAPPVGKAGGSRRITGQVVDDHGRPVAGARVAAASSLFADAADIGLQAFVVSPQYPDDLRIATSDAGGRFVIQRPAARRGSERCRMLPARARGCPRRRDGDMLTPRSCR